MKPRILTSFATALFVCGSMTPSARSAENAAPSASPSPVPPAVTLAAEPFDLSSVKLLDSQFKDAQELDHKYLLALDADRLLHNFRVTAGLPSTAEPLGGWESPKIGLRGHFVGHYLSALALMYKSTGDKRLLDKGNYIVAELAKCQDAIGTGYLSAFPATDFDMLETKYRGVWAPYYTIHKIMAGLLDMYQLCGNKQALEVDNKMATYFGGRMDKLKPEQIERILHTVGSGPQNEFGGMSEVLHSLYAITGNPDTLKLANTFDRETFLGPLAQGHDNLANLHANTHIPQVIGIARHYEVTGDERMRTAAQYFWEEVTRHRSFAPGDNSFNEHFKTLGLEANGLSDTTAETCNVYNMLKLTRHVFEWNPNAEAADFYERALYNHILGSIDMDNGMTTYFMPLKAGHFKSYGTPLDTFWCCTGTGVENHAKYGDSIYFHSEERLTEVYIGAEIPGNRMPTLWVNLFIPSVLKWEEKGITVLQDTAFPKSDTTLFTFKTAKQSTPPKTSILRLIGDGFVSPPKQNTSVMMAIKLRVPYWATNGVTVKVNGRVQDVTATPQSYITINGYWKDGDTLEYTLPMSFHLYRASDDPDSVAIFYGPLVLAGEMGREGMPPSDHTPDNHAFDKVPDPKAPMLVSESADPATWLKPVEPVAKNPLTFKTVGVGKPTDLTLIPLYEIQHERYNVYWKLLTPAKFADWTKKIAAEEAAKREFALRVVDDAKFGDKKAEKAHNFQSEKSRSGSFKERPDRDATDGGWFSADMKVIPNEPLVLQCTYWGSDVPMPDGPRVFDVLVDGQKIATQTLDNNKPEEFFDVEYPIPAELLTGKTQATVKFQAHEKSMAGGVFGCAILKAKK